MAHHFAKVSEEEIEKAFFYPSDLVNTKTPIPLWVGEERWKYTSTLRVYPPLFTSPSGDSCILFDSNSSYPTIGIILPSLPFRSYFFFSVS